MKAGPEYRNQIMREVLTADIERNLAAMRNEACLLASNALDVITMKTHLGSLGQMIRRIDECQVMINEINKP